MTNRSENWFIVKQIQCLYEENSYTSRYLLCSQTDGQFVIECLVYAYYNMMYYEKNCEIIVKGIPREGFDYYDVIQNFFEFGKTSMIRLMMDFSGSNRGYCFIRYLKPCYAQEALQKLNGWEMFPNMPLKVAITEERTLLFVDNIPKDLEKHMIIKAFSRIVGVTQIIIYQDINYCFLNRGYVFIDFYDQQYASIARKLIPGLMYQEWGVEANRISWATKRNKLPEEVMSRVSNVILRGICRYINVDFLRQLIASKIDFPNSQIKRIDHHGHYAFIYTGSRAVGEAVIKALNGITVNYHILQADFAWPSKTNFAQST